jgi:hypothetical protein
MLHRMQAFSVARRIETRQARLDIHDKTPAEAGLSDDTPQVYTANPNGELTGPGRLESRDESRAGWNESASVATTADCSGDGASESTVSEAAINERSFRESCDEPALRKSLQFVEIAGIYARSGYPCPHSLRDVSDHLVDVLFAPGDENGCSGAA